jgi:hypothetical protein
MKQSVRVVHELITRISPGDEPESEHRLQALRWLESTDDIFRRHKPATPAVFADPTRAPAFVTVTETVGVDHGHTDVSLWFLLRGQRGMAMTLDVTEFRSAQWWTPGEIAEAASGVLDPHYQRFAAKAMGPS